MRPTPNDKILSAIIKDIQRQSDRGAPSWGVRFWSTIWSRP
jgi:hypothetical protein